MFEYIKRASLIKYFIICLFFLFVSVFITYPLVFHLPTQATGIGDELLLSWIQTWVSHIIFTDPLKLFEAPSFYPFHNSLAYSDSLVTSSILFYPVYLIFQEAIVFQNITLIASLWLLGFSTYALCFYLFRRHFSAVLSGLMIVFSPVVLDKYVHLQVLFIFFVPLAFLLFIHFLKSHKILHLVLAMTCFVLQTLNSFLPGYFIAAGFIVILLTHIFFEKKKLGKENLIKIMIALIVSVIVLLPFILPYYRVSSDFQYTRDIRDSIHFALQPEDLLYANSFTRLSPILESLNIKTNLSQNPSFKNGYPGFILLVASIFSTCYTLKKWKKQRYEIKSFFILGIGGLILSLGPFLHIGRLTIHHPFPVPLPYLLFYYLIPGFNGLRNSARWEVLFIACFSILAGYYLGIFISKYKGATRFLLAALVILVLFIEYQSSFHFVNILPRKKFPEEYSWLSHQPKNTVIIELPIYNWNFFPYATKELQRQYYSTVHFRKSINGASGFSPPPWQEMIINISRKFPSKESIIALRDLNINYIIVHSDEYNRLHNDRFKFGDISFSDGNNINRLLINSNLVKKVKVFNDTIIYQIL